MRRLRLEEIPNDIAYFDGTRYYCYNTDCFIDNAELHEVCKSHICNDNSYIPILRCSGCGKFYFGMHTWNIEEKEEPPTPTPQKEQPRTDDEGDIILPNMLTV